MLRHTISSAHYALLANSWEWDGERNHRTEGRSEVKIKVVSSALSVTQPEIVICLLFAFLNCLLQLEVSGWCFLDAPEEVKRVAASLLIELGLHVLKAGKNNLLFLGQVIQCDTERPWFLREEVWIILNRLYQPLLRQEALWQFFHLRCLQAEVIQVEPCAKHVGLEDAHVVLAVQAEDILSIRDDEISILRLTSTIKCGIRLAFFL